MPPRKKQTKPAEETSAPKRKAAPRKKPAKKTDADAKPKTPSSPRATSSRKKTTGDPKGPTLLIVESPTKAKTLGKYLGSGYRILASYGHVRDLPKRRKKGELVAGIDISTWTPTYVVHDREDGKARGRRTPKDVLAELKKEAGKASRVFLATDPDREGEAIAWHIEDELNLDDATTFRVAFNEITKAAVQHAVAHPTKIDMDRVKAQEARRMLDRVVGYPLSNLLSQKVARALSAGRVQSVALRLVVDREREIENFKSEEYWRITALLAPEGKLADRKTPLAVLLAEANKQKEETPESAEHTEGEEAPEQAEKRSKPAAKEVPEGSFLAELAEWNGKKFEAQVQDAALNIANSLDRAAYTVSKIEQKDRQDRAPAPFTTSTLQQQASLKLHFNADRTMRTAQKLYEGVELGSEGSVGLITYMRTDSKRVSNEAITAVRKHIETNHGKPYLPDKPNVFASGKSAQEAHEAIRPTDVDYTPARVAALGLHGDQLRLYTLIYQRFVASQMAPAVFAVTNVEVTATQKPEGLVGAPQNSSSDIGLFKAQGRILKFDGYRKVYAPSKQEDATLPALAEKQALDRLGLTASQHFTQPPPRYNEASLVKALEKEGIGRPSTYASILNKITSESRGYIEVKERRFYATELGKKVTDLLVEHFKDVMNVKFTSQMEEDLDQIETKQTEYHQVLDKFWEPFYKDLTKAEKDMPSQRGVETGEMCPRCGRPLVKSFSKKTKREFIGCSGFKEGCKYIKPAEGEPERPEPIETEHKCPSCGKPMLQRVGPRGTFLGCSGYPECKITMNLDDEGNPVLTAKPTEHTCEKCGSPMVLREGRRGPFLACSGYPKCKNAKDVDAEGNPIQPADLGINCEKCGSPMAIRRGPRGMFLGCTAYPKCRGTKQLNEELREQLKDKLPAPPPKREVPDVQVTETCPECGGPMKLRPGRGGKFFLGCANYPKCKGTREAPAELASS